MIEETTLQSFADMICEDRNVSRVSVRIAPPRARKHEFLRTGGSYNSRDSVLKLYFPNTPDRDDVKQTILHELAHHLDRSVNPRIKEHHGRSFYSHLNSLMNEYGVTGRALEAEIMAYRSFSWQLLRTPRMPYLIVPVLTATDPESVAKFVSDTQKYSKRKFYNDYFAS